MYRWAVLCLVPTLALAQDIRWREVPALRFEEPVAPISVAEELPPVPPASLAPLPLFPRHMVAKDTPELLLTLAENRTLENARAYFDWDTKQRQAIREIEALWKQVLKERKGR